MKKLGILLSLFLALGLVFSSCATAKKYAVTFEANGGDTEPNPTRMEVTVPPGTTQTVGSLPQAPSREGYSFDGWNTKADGSGSAFTGSTPVTENITVYAQWQEIPPPPPPPPPPPAGDPPPVTVEPTPTPPPVVVTPPPAPAPAPAPAPTPPPAAPVLGVLPSPRTFTPDGDGLDERVTINLHCSSESAITNWSFEIFNAESPNASFYKWSGMGNPPPSMVWDGKSTNGSVAQSAMDYPYTFSVTSAAGTFTETGHISTDIYVVRSSDGQSRIRIPSVIFATNSAGFYGLSKEVMDRNDATLRRVADMLIKNPEYKVRVEGYANQTATTTAAIQRENPTLIELSEERAKNALDFLVLYGANPSQLSYVGRGGARPVAPYRDRNDWWENRRVEFVLIK